MSLYCPTAEFLRRIPKTDLHVHLDGSLRLTTLIELARTHGVTMPSHTEAGLRELVFKDRYANLQEYLTGFAYTCAVLRDAESLERVAFELAEDNIAEGVRYIEVRFAPQLLVHEGLSMEDALAAVARGIERAKRAHNATAAVAGREDVPFEFGIIACAMRRFSREMGTHYRDLLSVLSRAPRREVYALASLEMARTAVAVRDHDGLPIVGFDLAGEEAGYPAAYHTAAFQFAHSHFLKKTVHAGEAYGPESIFQAITECHANRIGHGTFLFASDMVRDKTVVSPTVYTERLAEYVASQRITIEVCPTSNLQTIPSIRTVGQHSLQRMIDYNLSVSICTDNRLVSSTTVSRELGLVASELTLTRRQFRNLVIAGFKGSFFPGSYNSKREYVRRVIDRYERLDADLLAGQRLAEGCG